MTHGQYKGIASRIFLLMLSVSAYSQSVYELWTTYYNGPGNGRDIAYSITTDNSGLVYVTGQSYGGVYGYDYPTIKYAPNGDTVWVRRYNGTGYGFDIAYALQMDNSSYVYVAGPSTGSSYDYATIKYTPGNTLSGTNILVQLTDSLLVVFDSIEIGGETTVHIESLGPFPPIDLNLVPSNPPEFYDIRTDVVYSGFIKTCLTYSQEIVNNEPRLLLCRYA